MGGHGGHHHVNHGPFVVPKVRGTLSTKVLMAGMWFFVMYRMKADGPHHFCLGLWDDGLTKQVTGTNMKSTVPGRKPNISCSLQSLILKHHPWEEPKVLAHLEKVDKKFGTHYATDNMHH
ncbi:hypothetical protein HDU77_011795 [Chytriomyces hyalinus]|nr:hypothetical protein HDU77_011795 [Chytriomyces hyalinus]